MDMDAHNLYVEVYHLSFVRKCNTLYLILVKALALNPLPGLAEDDDIIDDDTIPAAVLNRGKIIPAIALQLKLSIIINRLPKYLWLFPVGVFCSYSLAIKCVFSTHTPEK